MLPPLRLPGQCLGVQIHATLASPTIIHEPYCFDIYIFSVMITTVKESRSMRLSQMNLNLLVVFEVIYAEFRRSSVGRSVLRSVLAYTEPRETRVCVSDLWRCG